MTISIFNIKLEHFHYEMNWTLITMYLHFIMPYDNTLISISGGSEWTRTWWGIWRTHEKERMYWYNLPFNLYLIHRRNGKIVLTLLIPSPVFYPILISFKIVVIVNTTSADIKRNSADIILKMTIILREMRMVQLCSQNERTLGTAIW